MESKSTTAVSVLRQVNWTLVGGGLVLAVTVMTIASHKSSATDAVDADPAAMVAQVATPPVDDTAATDVEPEAIEATDESRTPSAIPAPLVDNEAINVETDTGADDSFAEMSRIDRLQQEMLRSIPPRQAPTARRTSIPQRGPAMPAPAPSTSQSPGTVTLAVWNTINGIIDREAAMRGVPSPEGLSADNAGDFLDRRIAAGEYAVEELYKLPTKDVDRDVLKLAGRLLQWYQNGVEVARDGRKLLASSISTRKGVKGQAYRNAEKKHAATVTRINSDASTVRDQMSRKYALGFPELH